MICCQGCNKEIVGQYVEALGHKWHSQHFVCTVCGKPFGDSGFLHRDGKPYCEQDYYEEFGEKCFGCGQVIKGNYVEALNHKWHKEHFVCTICRKPFGSSGFLQRDEKPYCEQDYYDQFATKCGICQKALIGEFLTDYWQNKFCKNHVDELPKCFSCSRLISKGITSGGVEYKDGRKICSLCRKTAIEDIKDAQTLFGQVRKVLAKLGLSVDASVDLPLRLASLEEIDRLAGGTPQTEAGISMLETQSVNGQEKARKVKEVVILFGLPREHTAAIMAHEFGHVWCFLHRMPQMPLELQEGICELFSFGYLSEIDTPESEFFRNGIARNEDPVYGGGFRQVNDARQGRSILAMLDQIRKTGMV